jgi:hypothetical protein
LPPAAGTLGHPKSVTPSRITENFAIFGFDLTADELAAIDALDTGIRGGPGTGADHPRRRASRCRNRSWAPTPSTPMYAAAADDELHYQHFRAPRSQTISPLPGLPQGHPVGVGLSHPPPCVSHPLPCVPGRPQAGSVTG